MLGVGQETALQICSQLNWLREDQDGLVYPSPVPSSRQAVKTGEGQLVQFTSTVSFLEK
jgi:hypothetical protein